MIIHRLLTHHRIDLTTVAGALCVYLLAGLFFAYVFWIVGEFDPPFFAQTNAPNGVDFVYFSFVTLATLGYGDLTPHRRPRADARGHRGDRRAALPRERGRAAGRQPRAHPHGGGTARRQPSSARRARPTGRSETPDSVAGGMLPLDMSVMVLTTAGPVSGRHIPAPRPTPPRCWRPGCHPPAVEELPRNGEAPHAASPGSAAGRLHPRDRRRARRPHRGRQGRAR